VSLQGFTVFYYQQRLGTSSYALICSQMGNFCRAS